MQQSKKRKSHVLDFEKKRKNVKNVKTLKNVKVG